jgi:hypothetical protein
VPKVIEQPTCPHCKAELQRPIPRSCPVCGGSLQQRFLASGCLTTKPLVLLFGLGLLWLLAHS